jgi:hypothetical protein
MGIPKVQPYLFIFILPLLLIPLAQSVLQEEIAKPQHEASTATANHVPAIEEQGKPMRVSGGDYSLKLDSGMGVFCFMNK